MNREGAPGKSPEEMYIQQKVRVLLMLRKMGSNVSARRLSVNQEGWGSCSHLPSPQELRRGPWGQSRLSKHRDWHVQFGGHC